MKHTLVVTLGLIGFGSAMFAGQIAKPQDYVIELSATSANVNRNDRPIQINLLRWSSEEEREAIFTAWTAPETVAPATEESRGGGGFGGRGMGGGAPEPEPLTPVEAVTTTLKEGSTLGYIWSDGPAGYSVIYADRLPLPDGGERILLATGRRLDAYTRDWTPTGTAAPTDYEFTLIELRLDSDGVGVGRTSLTTEVTVEDATGTLVLDDYEAAAVIFDDVTRML